MFRPKPLRPPFDPFLGQPQRLPPTPTLRQLQMQAAHRGRGPGGWQTGGVVGYQGGGRTMNPRAGGAAAARRYRPTPATAAERLAMAPIPIPNPGGWYAGGDVDVDSREALMAEREMLQQQLQMADEVTAREIMAQIMEINKELEMEARNFGMAGGGLASLMGG